MRRRKMFEINENTPHNDDISVPPDISSLSMPLLGAIPETGALLSPTHVDWAQRFYLLKTLAEWKRVPLASALSP